MNTIRLSSNSNEWYTPLPYIKAARELMREIDLDPASCEEANKIVKASKFYTQQENGLLHPWYGRVWLNPPYGRTSNQKSNVAHWVKRLVTEYELGHVTEAILLVCNHTETQWFQLLWEYLVCLTDHRINFYPKTSGGASFGSAIVYFGSNKQRFIDIFSQFGTVVKRADENKAHLTSVNLDLWEVPA